MYCLIKTGAHFMLNSRMHLPMYSIQIFDLDIEGQGRFEDFDENWQAKVPCHKHLTEDISDQFDMISV